MRSWLLVLMTVTTLASLSLAYWYWRRADRGDIEPPIEIARVPDRIAVLAGGDEGLELLLRPYLPEAGQDAFNRTRLDQLLGLREPGHDYLRLWVVNRGQTARPFDVLEVARFEAPGHPGWQARSLAELIAADRATGTASPADRFVLEGLARGDLREIAPQSFVEVIVALPREPDWRELERLVVPALGSIELRRAEVAPDALDDFLARPRGELLDRLVFPTAEPSVLQASRR